MYSVSVYVILHKLLSYEHKIRVSGYYHDHKIYAIIIPLVHCIALSYENVAKSDTYII